ncbi:uncharacterized protein LOC110346309 [Heterocephalus glaber]|uniref:Uncharacterized protein LOC110346309 n=1 Tax=Heterocephalus glaber TaxID=10181 RepID=A0AAX6S4I8_HETGA|nr:uncharacterized protein LOC110346309 [Heterocephalus glaber]
MAAVGPEKRTEGAEDAADARQDSEARGREAAISSGIRGSLRAGPGRRAAGPAERRRRRRLVQCGAEPGAGWAAEGGGGGVRAATRGWRGTPTSAQPSAPALRSQALHSPRSSGHGLIREARKPARRNCPSWTVPAADRLGVGLCHWQPSLALKPGPGAHRRQKWWTRIALKDAPLRARHLGSSGLFLLSGDAAVEAIRQGARHQPLSKFVLNGGKRLAFRLRGGGRKQNFDDTSRSALGVSVTAFAERCAAGVRRGRKKGSQRAGPGRGGALCAPLRPGLQGLDGFCSVGCVLRAWIGQRSRHKDRQGISYCSGLDLCELRERDSVTGCSWCVWLGAHRSLCVRGLCAELVVHVFRLGLPALVPRTLSDTHP